MEFDIKPAANDHFERLRQIELAAFETLRAAGGVSGEPVANSEKDLQRFLDDDFLLAAFDADGNPVAYAGGTIVESFLYIAEVDVHPNFQRRGLGRLLVQALLDKARSRGLAGATLTTDRLVPFNAPFYQSMGFAILEREECPAFLIEILKHQIEKGLEPERRVAMRMTF